MGYDRILVLDFETTGLDEDAQPCEVAWIEIDQGFNKLSEFSSLVKPTVPMSPTATEVNGISDEMLADAPSITEVMEQIKGEKVLLIAHNAVFDARHLRPFCEVDSICTKRLAWSTLPGVPNHKLSVIAEHLKLDAIPSHRALADVETCLSFLKYLWSEKGMNLWEMKALSDAAILTMEMPFGKHKGTPIKALPRSYVGWMRENMTNLNGDLLEALNKHFPKQMVY